MEPWRLSTLRPRYHAKSWNEDAYRNWRDKTVQCLAVDIDNDAPPIITVPYVESDPIVVTVVGSNDNSSRVSESVIMDSISKQLVTPFQSYESITKKRISTYNVIITDADGQEISLIYNNSLKAMFRIVDISSYPFTNIVTSTDIFLMECLYKKTLFPLHNDEDEFIVPNFDDIIINKAVQLRYEDTGNIEKALLADKKASRTSDRRSAAQFKGFDIRVEPQEDQYSTIFHRMRRRSYR
jgi:hypothetical protein